MNTKDKIMKSTFKLLLEKGLIDVSLSEIIKESQVGYGSIYYYFEDKDQLIQTVLNRYIIEIFLNQLESIKLTDDLFHNLNEFYMKVLGLNEDYTYISYENLSIDNSDFKKMILLTFEAQQKYEKEQEFFNQYNIKFTSTIKDIINKGIKSNQVAGDINIDEITELIKSNIYGIFFLWLIRDIEDVESSIKINVNYIMDVLT